MSISDLARLLFLFGAIFAIVGPAISAIRTARRYKEAQSELTGTWHDPAIDPDHIRTTARLDAWWGVAEFGLVGLGVALAAIASIILIP